MLRKIKCDACFGWMWQIAQNGLYSQSSLKPQFAAGMVNIIRMYTWSEPSNVIWLGPHQFFWKLRSECSPTQIHRYFYLHRFGSKNVYKGGDRTSGCDVIAVFIQFVVRMYYCDIRIKPTLVHYSFISNSLNWSCTQTFSNAGHLFW